MAGAALIAVAVAVRAPTLVSYGGAMVLAVALGRAVATASVTRLRAAGFEMVWTSSRRVLRAARETVTLEAEPAIGATSRCAASRLAPSRRATWTPTSSCRSWISPRIRACAST
ncbi:MAG: hypothetical protein U0235_10910 [Polyangiaceae bacterium]